MDDVAKAAECVKSLRWLATGNFDVDDARREMLDAANIIEAEHPADDAEPIDEAWLRSLFAVEPGRGVCLTGGLSIFNTKNGWRLYAILDEPDEDRWAEGVVGTIKTRGDVRRLASALGIPLATP